MPLGDAVSTLLNQLGITEERVEKWLGKPCGCPARRRKLNMISQAAEELAKGVSERAVSRIKRALGMPSKNARD